VARETSTVKFDPIVVDAVETRLSGVVKIVGVSDDLDLVKATEAEAQKQFGHTATVARSQPYYLDITHPDANKGGVVAYLAKTLKLEPHQIATIGDQPNDVLMFKPSGYSVAMGNADDDVKHQATVATDDVEHEGFAKAVERLIAEHGTAAP
jgi:hydroxymethylpyrimidine pyrophosphatase-like HAD family hydrolase